MTDSRDHQETELKLVGDPAALSAVFRELEGTEATTSQVTSTYYDTDDRRILRRGYSLRLRHSKGGFELTLKTQNGKELDRGEWSTKLPEPTVDIGRLPPEAPRSELGVILPEELAPVYTSEIVRSSKTIATEGAEIEVSLDLGRIVSGARDTPIAELEFELLAGSVVPLLEQVKANLGKRRLAISTRSKASRGIDLADGAPPARVTAEKPTLDPSATIEDALSLILRDITAHVLGNLAAASDGRDPEGVHQLRVALRRLRSLFSLFEGRLSEQAKALDKRAKKALGVLGRARDLDVFVTETMPPLLTGNGDAPTLASLVAVAEARRSEAQSAVRRLISKPSFTRFLIDLMIALRVGGLLAEEARDEPVRPAAAALIERLHEKALTAGQDFANLSYAERHRVRIALKKLRYACSYFQSLFPKKRARAYLKRLSLLQDDLGQLNDASVAQHIVEQLAADAVEGAIDAALVKGWYRHRLHSVEPHMVDAWVAFTQAPPFWRTEQDIRDPR